MVPPSRRDVVSDVTRAELPSTGKVLVADDVEQVRATLVSMLADIDIAWLVDEASTAEQALDLAKRTRYKLILMDENFDLTGGRLTGTQATAILREAGGKNTTTLVVGLTENAHPAHATQAFYLGQDAILCKPLSGGETFLRQLVRRLHAEGCTEQQRRARRVLVNEYDRGRIVSIYLSE